MSKAAQLAALIGSQTALSNRNLIINGAMQVWQRATTATTVTNGAYQTADRYSFNQSNDGAYTTEQSTDTPTGTGYSLKAQVTTADASIASSQYAYIEQNIEAQNLQSLQYGTSNAKSITLSFWVKSNKTGTYTILFRKLSGTGVHLVHEYTIDSANTWEKKEITISPTAGSTSIITSSTGAITADNNNGIQIGWNLAFGSTYNGATNNTWTTNTNHYATSNQLNWMDSTSNNFYLTGVQLEVGEIATPFEHEGFGTTLAKCQRYYAIRENSHATDSYYFSLLTAYNTTSVYGFISNYPATMRSTPTVSQSGSFGAYQKTSATASMATTIGSLGSTNYGWFTGGWGGSGVVAGDASVMFALAGAKLMADAEL